jgi:hypothetical protein
MIWRFDEVHSGVSRRSALDYRGRCVDRRPLPKTRTENMFNRAASPWTKWSEDEAEHKKHTRSIQAIHWPPAMTTTGMAKIVPQHHASLPRLFRLEHPHNPLIGARDGLECAALPTTPSIGNETSRRRQIDDGR